MTCWKEVWMDGCVSQAKTHSRIWFADRQKTCQMSISIIHQHQSSTSTIISQQLQQVYHHGISLPCLDLHLLPLISPRHLLKSSPPPSYVSEEEDYTKHSKSPSRWHSRTLPTSSATMSESSKASLSPRSQAHWETSAPSCRS